MCAGDAKQGAEGEMQGRTGVTGSERNASQRNCTKMKSCRKMQGTAGTKRERNANEGVFKEMKGAETAVKWKEVKGHARKLSGKTCKGSKVRIIPRTSRT